MAFQAMMGGSECSTSNNPLSSLLKQQQTDHSLHHPQFSGPTPLQAGQGGSMRTANSSTPPMISQEEADRFLHHNGGANPLEMAAMRRELDNVAHRNGPLKGDREWSSQYQPTGNNLNPAEMARMKQQFRMQQLSNHSSNFAAEFSQQRRFTPNHVPSSSSPGPSSSASTLFNRPGFAPSYGSYSNLGNMHAASRPVMYQQPLRPRMDEGAKGKDRFVELDDQSWQEQFDRAASTHSNVPPAALAAATREAVVEDQPVTKANLLAEGEIDLDASESDAQLMKDLEATWTQLKGQLDASSKSDRDLAEWEAQYGSQFNDLHLSDDEHEDGLYGLPESIVPSRAKAWTRDNVDGFLQDDSPFPYAEENQFLDSQQQQDPYEEGLRLLSVGAPLSEAALAFEAACRRDESRAEAWKAAGETWAADEREAKGIRALEKAVACGGPHGVAAWMSLAVAYVNEGQELRALATLEKWISLSYPTVALPPTPQVGSIRSPWDASNRVIDLFLAAAQAGPLSRAEGQILDANAPVDPDVQVGLGVLFYSNSDYERAKDCFEAALSVRPDDFLLWNRLGATLANGGLPEEAIQAYRKALELRPTFTRATYNLGVSCLNIGCYHEAAEHLLAAIQGQTTRNETVGKGKGPATGDEDLGRGRPIGEADDGSANLWHTLRRAFLCMERHDLADRAFPGASVNDFRAEGFEF